MKLFHSCSNIPVFRYKFKKKMQFLQIPCHASPNQPHHIPIQPSPPRPRDVGHCGTPSQSPESSPLYSIFPFPLPCPVLSRSPLLLFHSVPPNSPALQAFQEIPFIWFQQGVQEMSRDITATGWMDLLWWWASKRTYWSSHYYF